MEQGKTTPTAARLNDVVAGRFRLVNVDAERVVLEDVNLGFRHEVKLDRTVQASTGPVGRPGGFPAPGGFQPYNPGGGQMSPAPGIPPNVPIYTPPQRPTRTGNTNSNVKRNVDDEDDDDEDTDNR